MTTRSPVDKTNLRQKATTVFTEQDNTDPEKGWTLRVSRNS